MFSFSGLVSELVSFVLEKGDQDSQVESKNDEGSKREREREREI